MGRRPVTGGVLKEKRSNVTATSHENCISLGFQKSTFILGDTTFWGRVEAIEGEKGKELPTRTVHWRKRGNILEKKNGGSNGLGTLFGGEPKLGSLKKMWGGLLDLEKRGNVSVPMRLIKKS